MSRSGQTAAPLSALAAWMERYHALADRARQLAADLQSLGNPPRPASADDEQALLRWRTSLGLPSHAAEDAVQTRAAVNAAGVYQGVGQIASTMMKRIIPAAEQAAGASQTVIRPAECGRGGVVLHRPSNVWFCYVEYGYLPVGHPLRSALSPDDCPVGRVILGPARWSAWHGHRIGYDWYSLSDAVDLTKIWRAEEIAEQEAERRHKEQQADAERRRRANTEEGLRERVARLEATLAARGETLP